MAKDEIICTCCGGSKRLGDFYVSNSDMYKSSGKLPICKKCVVKLYDGYKHRHEDEKYAIYYTCRKLDICFNMVSFVQAVQEKDKGKTTSLCQLYMTKLNSLGKKSGAGDDFDSSDILYEPTNGVAQNTDTDTFIATRDVVKRWGSNWTHEELEWLETNYHEWTTRHEANTLSLERIFQMICIKELEIRNARMQNKSTDKLEKSLRELLNDSNLTPKNMSAIHEDKNTKTFGLWLKDIEQHRPAEYFEDKKIYHDFDGIGEYFDRFVLRPMKNLLTGTRDFDKEFNIETLEGEDNG